jgi:hypothetical protein
MAIADYNGVNIRLRTAFQNIKNEKWFCEISTGVVGESYRWIVITALFRVDRIEDENLCYTKEASEIINRYYKEHNEYNQKNINKLFNELMGIDVELNYINTFNDGSYFAHNKDKYNLGHELYKSDIKVISKQMTLFDFLGDE